MRRGPRIYLALERSRLFHRLAGAFFFALFRSSHYWKAQNNMTDLRHLRANSHAARQGLIRRAEAEGRTEFTAEEENEFRRLTNIIDDLNDRIDLETRSGQLHASADRFFTASQARGHGAGFTAAVDSPYDRDRRHSFTRDLLAMATPAIDPGGEFRTRLAEQAERRDVSGLDTSVGNAGTFSPPAYLLSLWARYSRPIAPLYSLLQKVELTAPVTNIPKLTAGGTASVQTNQNTSITTSQFTDEYLQTTAKTIAAATVVSQQLLDLSPMKIDDIVFQDLFAALATEVEANLLYDSTYGLDATVTASGISASVPGQDVDDLYGAISKALYRIATTRYNTSNVIGLAHPGTLLHWQSKLDSEGRPLFAPSKGQGAAFNPVGVVSDPGALGDQVRPALSIQGVPFFSDANIAVNGGGTAPIYIVKLDDAILSTRGPVSYASPDPLAAQLSWLLRVHSYLAPTWRYPEAMVRISGFPAAEAPAFGS